MTPVKNIALVYECDQSSLERAARMARDCDARLTIVYRCARFPRRTRA
jgi:hypothetical protein